MIEGDSKTAVLSGVQSNRLGSESVKLLQETLLLTKKIFMSDHYLSCSAIGQRCSGPCLSATVSEGPLGEMIQSRVSGVVVIRWRVRLEAYSGLLPRGPTAHPALGQWVSWRAQEQTGEYVLQGSSALTKARH